MADSRAETVGYESPGSRDSGVGALLILIRVLAGIAVVVCGYLIWIWASGSLPVGCDGTSDCNELLGGMRSKWFDVPVSIPGAVVYLGILLAALAGKTKAAPAKQRRCWEIMTVLAILAGGAALWFIGTQVVLGRVCIFCMTVHACGMAITVAVAMGLRRLPAGRRESSYRIIPGIRPDKIWLLSLLSCLGLVALIVGQVLSSRPNPVVSFSGGGSTRERPSRATAPATAEVEDTLAWRWFSPWLGWPKLPEAAPVVPVERQTVFNIGDDLINLDPTELPIIGSPDAQAEIAIMTDYTCPHCRDAHPMWKRVMQAFGDQLVIVVLPLPMDSKHNQRMKVTTKMTANSYELAKIAMAVWRADRKAFEKMDDWLFEVQPRGLEAARAYATQLVGEEAFQKALKDPWIDQELKRNVKIYDLDGGGPIPKVLLTKPIKGEIKGEIGLILRLEQELGIRRVRGPGNRVAPGNNTPATTQANTPATLPIPR